MRLFGCKMLHFVTQQVMNNVYGRKCSCDSSERLNPNSKAAAAYFKELKVAIELCEAEGGWNKHHLNTDTL